jgi:hypothetical protein
LLNIFISSSFQRGAIRKLAESEFTERFIFSTLAFGENEPATSASRSRISVNGGTSSFDAGRAVLIRDYARQRPSVPRIDHQMDSRRKHVGL